MKKHSSVIARNEALECGVCESIEILVEIIQNHSFKSPQKGKI